MLGKINKPLIEKWLLDLRSQHTKGGSVLSDVAINHAFTCFKIMLNRAVEMELSYRNPMQGILKLRETSKERGILTLDEIKALFGDDSLFDVWGGNLKCFTATMLSLVTGMRQGEVLGLQMRYVFKDHIAIMQSWGPYGLIEPKWGSQRYIPIPEETAHYLDELITMSPYQEDMDFVFYGQSRDVPIGTYALLQGFYCALRNIGINEEQRKDRNLVFHGLRHTFNSMMRGKIPDAKLQRFSD